jgi:predicted dehydrogenase
MKHIRLGVIGCGARGRMHLEYLHEVERLTLGGVCDSNAEKARQTAQKHGVKSYADPTRMFRSGEIDAVLIATPHDCHSASAVGAFEHGLHVLTEKPVAVSAKAAAEMNAAHARHAQLIYAAMFPLRAVPLWKQVKQMIHDGLVGELSRVSWTLTTWFCNQAYYDASAWRATWEGEGGGILLTPCADHLDLLQWLVGLPQRVTAVVKRGKHHHVEVEDEVLALLEFEHGATGSFITCAGEAPGVDHLEIVGDHGTIIVSEGVMRFWKADSSIRRWRQSCEHPLEKPATSEQVLDVRNDNRGCVRVMQNFVNAIRRRETLIAHGEEGVRSLELGNAMLMSGITGRAVAIPTDHEAYELMLRDLIQASTLKRHAPVV